MKLLIIIAVVISLIFVGLYINNDLSIEVVNNQKVVDLEQQQIISGHKTVNTKIRYLVITDKETFICESSVINGKYNNADIFYHLKKDSIYNFKVCGKGKSLLYDYRNIIDIVK